MKTKNAGALFVLTMVLVSGCGQKPAENAPTGQTASSPAVDQAAAGIPQPPDPVTVATLRGKVFFQGSVPPAQEISVLGNPECAVFHPNGKVRSEELLATDGALQNVFVYVKEGLEGRSFPAPTAPLTIENKNCVYVPHVTGAQVDQPVVFLNGDPTLHNVHTYSKNSKSWNLGLPIQGMKQTKKFEAPEVMVSLKCDVHPWMKGYIGVLPHPYFSVTGTEGRFEIKDLPPGDYVIEVWHEKLGVQSQKIKIEPQETKEIEFKFGA